MESSHDEAEDDKKDALRYIFPLTKGQSREFDGKNVSRRDNHRYPEIRRSGKANGEGKDNNRQNVYDFARDSDFLLFHKPLLSLEKYICLLNKIEERTSKRMVSKCRNFPNCACFHFFCSPFCIRINSKKEGNL